jgi:serine/threonine-protein kinase RsbW
MDPEPTDLRSAELLATHCLRFPPSLGELSRARSFAADLAGRAGFGARRIFDITVAVSEACANAIEHSRSTESLELAARLFADRLEFDVFTRRPFRMPATAYVERAGRNRGMGLPLMAFLSDRLAVSPRVRGGTLVSRMFLRGLSPGPRPRRRVLARV